MLELRDAAGSSDIEPSETDGPPIEVDGEDPLEGLPPELLELLKSSPGADPATSEKKKNP